MDNSTNSFLASSLKLFRYYKSLADSSIKQVSEEKLFEQTGSECNSIAIIANHLAGNMLSRWTDFLTSDGEKSWRNRDAEFENAYQNKEEMLSHWEKGWTCLFNALESLKNEDLDSIVYIRNEGHTVMEAITRQLCHYSYHVGQIVFLAKIWCNENWVSLSIPKNKSEEYNQNKFNAAPSKTHFTDKV